MARRRYEQEEIVNLHTVCIRAEPQCKSYENYGDSSLRYRFHPQSFSHAPTAYLNTLPLNLIPMQEKNPQLNKTNTHLQNVNIDKLSDKSKNTGKAHYKRAFFFYL